MNEEIYNQKLEQLFVRFPSVQNVGFNDAYKPGLGHMEAFNAILGHPDRQFKSIHVAGTNGKGSVANMTASALAATGLKTGLYTSPHILDFRERMRATDENGKAYLISKEDVWDFITTWEETFDKLNLSFFEITTGMAFWWFAKEKVDVAVIEVGLGGRLDSTNIIIPELTVVTSIGLDHCAMLGNTRAAIAGEKAGIFKPGVQAVVGSRDDETAPVFKKKAEDVSCPLTFADGYELTQWTDAESIASAMDLQGEYQGENLRTVLTVLEKLGVGYSEVVKDAIIHTAGRMDFHGRWEKIYEHPDVICDIGHNPPALTKNFAQLEGFLACARYTRIIIVYGVMKDKDLDGILPLMPLGAEYITVAPASARAMDADILFSRCQEGLTARGLAPEKVIRGGSVAEGVAIAMEMASEDPDRTLVYIGGSTFVVSEATEVFNAR